MHGQGARLAESFSALVALEWFLFGMNVAVITQVVLPTESFTANVTGIGSFVRMRALMNQ